MTDDTIKAARLRQVPTTVAADILRDHHLFERSIGGLTPMTLNAQPFAGPVRIIEFLPGRPELRGRPGPPLNFEIIDAVMPGEVLVLGAGGSLRGAIFGDMLAERARHRGAAGAIVDGAVRDLAGLEEASLPVHARGIAPMAAHDTLVPHRSQSPIRFGEVTILPDDWVLADRDGILVLPMSLVDLVLERGDSAATREALSRHLLRSGFALAEVFPLQAALGPLLDEFRSTGVLPSSEHAKRILEGGR